MKYNEDAVQGRYNEDTVPLHLRARMGASGVMSERAALRLLNGARGKHKLRRPPAFHLEHLPLHAPRRQSRRGEHSPQGAQVNVFSLF